MPRSKSPSKSPARAKSPAKKSPAKKPSAAKKSPAPARSKSPAPRAKSPARKSPKPSPRAKVAVLSPSQSLAGRRAPRSASQPKRLGMDDDWGNAPAGKWESESAAVRKSAEEKKSKSRAAYIAKANRAIDAAGAGVYGKLRVQYPRTITAFEGAALFALGAIGADVYGEKEVAVNAALVCALYGALVSLIVGCYLSKLRKVTLLKNSKLADGAAKAALSQLILTPLLGLFYLTYFPLAETGELALPSVGSFVELYKSEVGLYLAADTVKYLLVPEPIQNAFFCATMVVWGFVKTLL